MGSFRLSLALVAWGACSLLFGCVPLDKAILRSSGCRYAIARAEYNLSSYYRNEFSITPAGSLKIEEIEPADEVLLLVHGFGTGEGVWGTLEDRDSPLNVAAEVFDGKVLIANYPSTVDIETAAEGLAAELEKIESKNGEPLPRLSVFAHSLGGEVARCMVRRKPECFREVALVSAPNTGLHFGPLTRYILTNYHEYYEGMMLRNGIYPERGNQGDFRTSMDDLLPGCDFLEDVNSPGGTSSGPIDVTYSFFIFQRTGENNILIPGKDDGLVSPGSAYPCGLIRRGEFEDVRFGTVTCFRGDVNHYTLMYNPDVMRTILRTLKHAPGPPSSSSFKSYREAARVYIPCAPSCEVEQRRRIDRFVSQNGGAPVDPSNRRR